ncbi:MAG: MDR/zinc-dependent alcohol dehydrogenase-like family protein [Planctomycetaceae bacterium]
MQAVCLGDDGVQFRLDYPDPTPAAGEVPVRVLLAGICETDLQLIRGYMGFRGVLGHEFVGVAEAGRFAGQRVAGEINCACGRCNLCLSGLGNHCPHRSVVGILRHDGVFAERVCLPEANLHPIPDHVSNVAAVFVEPLAAAFQIPAQLDLSSVKRAIVLGDGRLGNLCGQVLNSRVSDLLVVGKHPPKLQRLTSLGIKTALLNDLSADRGADLVVDCTGSEQGLHTALQLVRPRGTVVLKTTTAAPQGPNLAAVVIDEINLIGSRCGPFATAVDALAKGDVVVESLMTGRFPLRQFDAAIVAATNGDGLKVLLDPHS